MLDSIYLGTIKMKTLITTLFLFLWLLAIGQSNRIGLKDLFGCWQYIEFVDPSDFSPIKESIWDNYVLELNDDFTYSDNKKTGDWKFDTENQRITLYKNEFTENEKEMAKYFNQSEREATKVQLSGLKIKDGYLYHEVVSEEEPFTIYAKYKRKNCP